MPGGSASSRRRLIFAGLGFTLQLGDQELRGFGAVAGNVVINGAGPSPKSDTLETILARIPASRASKVDRPTPKTSFTLDVENALDVPGFRDRTFFSPDRSNREPSVFERRERNRHISPYITVKHSFG